MGSNYRFLPDYTEEGLAATQLQGFKWTVRHAYEGSVAYREKLKEAGVAPGDIRSLDDLTRLPFTSVQDLRAGYPFPLVSVPMDQVVRVHASSGTTGKRKVLAYSRKDIEDWKDMMARCFELAGLSREDRVQIAVGYGLWTAGAGFQLGCEHFGAMALPLGPGNLDFQLQFLQDMQSTCMCSTASMALLLAEQVEKHGVREKIGLKKLIFGSEPHTVKMRKRVLDLLGAEDAFDISGLTELYGPGAGLECSAHEGIHYWADYYILEIVDPVTLHPVPPGEMGEMVITTLCKEAAPLIRYRTRDLCRIIPGKCSCGLSLPMHDKIMGRSDDMIIFRGVNIYPGQIADVLEHFPEVSSEYQIHLTRKGGLDHMLVSVERKPGTSADMDANLSEAVSVELRKKLLVRGNVRVVDPLGLPRTYGKSKRVVDERNGD
ncbi:phenylacetate--CoA ligase family protein [Desulfoplanes sp.]